MAHCTNKNYRPRKYGFGGGIAIGGILGGYLGYKIGRARPQKYGFDTENKIGKGIKKTFSKKKKRMRYGGKTRGYFNNDPRVIRARFNTLCAETGKPIKKGQECVYYPSSKQCFSLDSKQAQEFREYMSDLDMGYNYAKGGSTYAVKPHADHREQDEFWKEMNSDSYAEDGGISDSRQRVAELLVSMDYDNGFYDEELDRNGVSVDDAIDWELNNRVKSDKDAQYYIEKYDFAKGGSTYYNGGGINDFEIGDKVMYDSYRDGTREGEILREIDDNHFEIGSDFGVSMVHKDKIIGYAPKRMFGLFEQGGNIDDIVAG